MNKKLLTPSIEDYLESIYNLDHNKEGVRSIDVAEKLSVSKPSVNRAVRTLIELGYITQEKYALIYLTDSGRKKAKEIFHRHTTIRMFLKEVLDIPENVAEEEACKIEHVISNDTVKRINDLVVKMRG